MRLSAHGVKLIASFEGFSARPYRDAAGVWTIGYGSTRGVGPHTAPVTRARALVRLRREVQTTYGAAVDAAGRRCRLSLTQNEFDALTSAVYNLGPGVLHRGSTLGDALASRNRHRIADALLVYNRGGGRVLLGLVRRRHAERRLFLKPPSKLARWRVELRLRRRQLVHARVAGTRRFLHRRIDALKRALRRGRRT